ncbi:hypothetical protein ACVW00_001846 [Marmoricola sp. URHA0025 HA25]
MLGTPPSRVAAARRLVLVLTALLTLGLGWVGSGSFGATDPGPRPGGAGR